MTPPPDRPAPLWVKSEAAFLANRCVRALGYAHGPGGPLLVKHLEGLAKVAERRADRAGEVETGWQQLADEAFLGTAEEAKAIVATAVELGMVEIVDEAGPLVTLFLTGYASSQAVPSQSPAAVKQRARRARRAVEKGDRGDTCTPDVAPSRGDMSPGRSGAVAPEGEGEGEGEGEAHAASSPAAPAREALPGPAEAEAAGLHPQLAAVMHVLESAQRPDGGRLVLEPLSIDSQLRAHLRTLPADDQERLALQAAHEAVAGVRSGALASTNGTSVFGGVLRQAVRHDRQPSSDGGRRRYAPGVSPVSETVKRGDEVLAQLVAQDGGQP